MDLKYIIALYPFDRKQSKSDKIYIKSPTYMFVNVGRAILSVINNEEYKDGDFIEIKYLKDRVSILSRHLGLSMDLLEDLDIESIEYMRTFTHPDSDLVKLTLYNLYHDIIHEVKFNYNGVFR